MQNFADIEESMRKLYSWSLYIFWKQARDEDFLILIIGRRLGLARTMWGTKVQGGQGENEHLS